MYSDIFNFYEILKEISMTKNRKMKKKLIDKLKNDKNHRALREICINYLEGNIKKHKKLEKYRNIMKQICEQKINKNMREKIYIQKGGFIGALLPVLASVLVSALK